MWLNRTYLYEVFKLKDTTIQTVSPKLVYLIALMAIIKYFDNLTASVLKIRNVNCGTQAIIEMKEVDPRDAAVGFVGDHPGLFAHTLTSIR